MELTEFQKRILDELGEAYPESADELKELIRLRDMSQHAGATNVLNTFITGFLDGSKTDAPFLAPVVIENADGVFRGSQGVGDLPFIRAADNQFLTVWHTPDFWARYEFFRTGTLALVHFSQRPTPVALRLDCESMGIKLQFDSQN